MKAIYGIDGLIKAVLFKTLSFLLLGLTSLCVIADVAPPDFRQNQSEQVWLEKIRRPNFQERTIIENSQSILTIKAPYTAEDASVVPISIHAKIPQTKDLYISKISVFVDKNPVPLVGEFELFSDSGKADLAMRIRVDAFSFVRAVAETNQGKLYMTKSFVRAKGACSAPPPAGMEDSKRLLGKMKMKLLGDPDFGAPNLMQLKIRHPNITGMAPLKIGGRTLPPPFFIRQLEVSFAGHPVLKANLTFSVSMDPAFRFFYVPQKPGEFTVVALDTKNNKFEHHYSVGG